MAAINDFKLPTIERDQAEAVRAQISAEAWRWYRANGDQVVIDRRVVIWKVKLRVRDLHEVFEALFGPER